MKPLRASGLFDPVGDDADDDVVGDESPRSMIALALRPTGVPAATAARSMSPVESCGMPSRSTRRTAWVPLPAPGGPSRMILIDVPLTSSTPSPPGEGIVLSAAARP